MVYKLYNLKNEFKRYFLESKSYGVDYISDKMADLIYLSGIFLSLYLSQGVIIISSLIRLLNWYILYNTVLNAVSDAEFEIRADFFKNLTYTKTSIWNIYFNRYIVYGIEAIGIFMIVFLFMNLFISFNLKFEINVINLLYYILLSIVVNLMIYFSIISLTFIFKRTMTFTRLITTTLLFITGMVFDFNNIFSNLMLSNIAKILNGYTNSSTFLLVVILIPITYSFIKYTDKYIHL